MTKIRNKLFLALIPFGFVFAGETDIIQSNYPLPYNNIYDIYEKYKDIQKIKRFLDYTNDFLDIKIQNNKIIATKKPIIKKIEVYGNKAFWDSEILAVSGIRENQSIDPQILENLPQRIKQFYADNGYLKADVQIQKEITDNGYIYIKINIDEGNQIKINDFIIISDISLSDEQISRYKNRLKNLFKEEKTLFFFSPKKIARLQEIQDKIDDFCDEIKKEGYYEAYCLLDGFDIKKDKADIKVAINFGTKYIVRFYGNQNFSKEQLEKFINFQDTGITYYWLRDFASRIENFYKENGYIDANIKLETEEENGTTYLNYYIMEGEKYQIDKINVYSDKEATKNYIIEKIKDKNLGEIYRFLENLKEKYIKNGYLNADFNLQQNVSDLEKKIDLYISFNVGKQYILGKVEFEGYPYKQKMKLPAVYNPEYILSIQDNFKRFMRDKGYLDSDVLLDVQFEEKEDKMYAKAIMNAIPGNIYENGDIFVYGSYYMKPSPILWQVSKEKYFNKEDFDTEVEQIYNSRLFDFVNPVLDTEDKKINKIYILHDDKRGYFQGSVGYNTDQQFKASISATLKNLFNYGFISSLYLERSNFQTNYRLAFGNTLLPYKLTGFVSGFKSTQTHRYYDIDFKGYDLTLTRRLNKWVTNILLLEYKNNDLSDKATTKSSFNTLKASLTIIDDHRDNKFDAKSGYYISGKLEKEFKDIDFYKIEISGRYYISFLDDYITFSQRFQTGYIYKNIEKLPLSERYYLGGISSMRGFAFEELAGKEKIGGKSFNLINNDLRFLIYPKYNLYGLVFADFGQVYSKKYEFSFRKTAGIGIYIPTPVGALIFDIAKKLDRKPYESNYRIEFSIGTSF